MASYQLHYIDFIRLPERSAAGLIAEELPAVAVGPAPAAVLAAHAVEVAPAVPAAPVAPVVAAAPAVPVAPVAPVVAAAPAVPVAPVVQPIHYYVPRTEIHNLAKSYAKEKGHASSTSIVSEGAHLSQGFLPTLPLAAPSAVIEPLRSRLHHVKATKKVL
ncbi:unnamed protein product [Cylicocyclus nassatus]|uniref:Uncharacterized protein n=1 Tax=Cylicocyclus nassatus TaxID=53992 RepID=A0AA36DM18_CYLNA|nr:unnamed protein product [Cylicocyclus nassatus]